jgi:hypothetical protein
MVGLAMSFYSSIRPESFRTDLRGSGVATGQRKFLSPSTGAETAASGKSSRLGKREKVLLRL